MLVIYVLSFQGPNGGVTFPMVGCFTHLVPRHVQARADGEHSGLVCPLDRACLCRQPADGGLFGLRRTRLPPTLSRLRRGVLFRDRQPRDAELLVGFGIGLGFQFPRLETGLFTSALGAQLTWTFPFGLFAMFAVVNRFNRIVRGSRQRSRRDPVAAVAPCHAADPAAWDHRCGDGRVHSVLRRVCAHHAYRSAAATRCHWNYMR